MKEQSLEGLADDIRRRAGVDPDGFVWTTKVAQKLLGDAAIALERELLAPVYLRPVDDGWQIVLNPESDEPRFHVACALAQWALRTLMGCTGSETQFDWASRYVAAAFLAPERVVRHSYERLGEDYRLIAKIFHVSQATIVLRIAELHGLERVVVVRSGAAHIRTTGAFPWERTPLAAVAKGSVRYPGIVRKRLRGGLDEGRVALLAV